MFHHRESITAYYILVYHGFRKSGLEMNFVVLIFEQFGITATFVTVVCLFSF